MTPATLIVLSTLAVATPQGNDEPRRPGPAPCEPGVAYLTADFSGLLEPVVKSIAGDGVLPAGLELKGVVVSAREARFELEQESGAPCMIRLGPLDAQDTANRGRWFSGRGDGQDLCQEAVGPILASVDAAFQADPWTPCTRGIEPPAPGPTRIYKTQPRPLVLAIALFHLLVLLVAFVAAVTAGTTRSTRKPQSPADTPDPAAPVDSNSLRGTATW